MSDSFRALVLRQDDDKKTHAAVETLSRADLPDGDVLVRVRYSSLNYKDGLAVTGTGRIIRAFPMVGGIDFVGEVVESQSERYAEGDAVILTGWGVGEKHWGGFAEYARVSSDWLVPLPEELAPIDAMTIGTAGFTAVMAVMALETNGLNPERGEVLVTGAGGGAGSVAIAALSALGYQVVASTGRDDTLHDYLTELGADSIIGRLDAPERVMLSARWAGVVDAVGGDTLANAIASTQYGGSVAAFGMAGGANLNVSVFPFILRGVNLLGVDSVMCPYDHRLKVWERATAILTPDLLHSLRRVMPLADVPQASADILAGQIRGRVVVDVTA